MPVWSVGDHFPSGSCNTIHNKSKSYDRAVFSVDLWTRSAPKGPLQLHKWSFRKRNCSAPRARTPVQRAPRTRKVSPQPSELGSLQEKKTKKTFDIEGSFLQEKNKSSTSGEVSRFGRPLAFAWVSWQRLVEFKKGSDEQSIEKAVQIRTLEMSFISGVERWTFCALWR